MVLSKFTPADLGSQALDGEGKQIYTIRFGPPTIMIKMVQILDSIY